MAKKSELDMNAIERAIQKAIPVDDEQIGYIGNEPVFLLCQYLKGVDMPDGTTFADLKPFFRQWYELSIGMLFDEYGDPLSFTEAWAQFIEAWPKVKYPKSAYLEQAKERAKNRKEPLPELAEFDGDYQYLGVVCYELQQIMRDRPFWLSTYDAGEILGKSQKVGHRAMKMLSAEGILELVKVGDRHNASEYRYIGKTTCQSSNNKMTAQEFEQQRKEMLEKLRS